MINSNHTKCDTLFLELSTLLENGTYQPHQRFFSVEKLKKQYQVSQSTVTETLKRLELQGYIYSRAKSGTYISPPQKSRQILLIARVDRTTSEELNAFLYHTELDASQKTNFKVTFIAEEEFLRDFDYLEILHRNVTGAIFFRLPGTFAAVRHKLESRGIIPVFYGSSLYRPQLGIDNCCYYDEKTVVHAILDRFYRAGHRKIGCAFIDYGVFAYRKQLYVDWMIEHDLFVDQKSLFEMQGKEYGTIHRMLSSRKPSEIGFTALFAAHHGLGMEAIIAFAGLGIRVPERVSIIGIGRTLTSNYVIPHQTSLLIDHSGDAVAIIQQMATAVNDPSVRIGGSSRIGFFEGQSDAPAPVLPEGQAASATVNQARP